MSGKVKGKHLDIQVRLLIGYELDGECWIWKGAKSKDGYGRVSYKSKSISVHRLSYLLFVGPIPKGTEIDHQCGVRACFNPKHLEAVTHLINIRRGRRTG